MQTTQPLPASIIGHSIPARNQQLPRGYRIQDKLSDYLMSAGEGEAPYKETFRPDLDFLCRGGLTLDSADWSRYYEQVRKHRSQIVIVFVGDNDICEHRTMNLLTTGRALFVRVKQRSLVIRQKCPSVRSVYWSMLGPRRGAKFQQYNAEAAKFNKAAEEHNRKKNTHLHFMKNSKAIREDRETGLPELHRMQHLSLPRDPVHPDPQHQDYDAIMLTPIKQTFTHFYRQHYRHN